MLAIIVYGFDCQQVQLRYTHGAWDHITGIVDFFVVKYEQRSTLPHSIRYLVLPYQQEKMFSNDSHNQDHKYCNNNNRLQCGKNRIKNIVKYMTVHHKSCIKFQ